jgi:hypothetical protein
VASLLGKFLSKVTGCFSRRTQLNRVLRVLMIVYKKGKGIPETAREGP